MLLFGCRLDALSPSASAPLLPFSRTNPRWATLPVSALEDTGGEGEARPDGGATPRGGSSIADTAGGGGGDTGGGGGGDTGGGDTNWVDTRPWRLLVTGPLADSLRHLSGGWTVHWQGATTDAPLLRQGGETILQVYTYGYIVEEKCRTVPVMPFFL